VVPVDENYDPIDQEFRQDYLRTTMCTKMLDEISRNIRTFRPSQSLYDLKNLTTDAEDGVEADEVEIDIVLSGGGLKGYFMAGCGYVLMEELRKQNIKIGRVAGTSAGSWAGMFLLTGFDTKDWLETYYACQKRPNLTLLEVYEEIWPGVRDCLPQDAYLTCTDRLHISVTEITWTGLKHRVISKFASNSDLFEACCASSMIPYLSHMKSYWHLKSSCGSFDMYCLDGGITNNTPVFPDGNNRQLVFRLYEVEYPWRGMLQAVDTCIETLTLRGGLLMGRFLQGEAMDSITWLEKKRNKEDLLIKPGYFIRIALLPVIVGGFIIGKQTGLSNALRAFFRGSKGGYVVPYNQATMVFGTSTLRYVSTVLLTTVINSLNAVGALL
jgi:hypothetical protein